MTKITFHDESLLSLEAFFKLYQIFKVLGLGSCDLKRVQKDQYIFVESYWGNVMIFVVFILNILCQFTCVTMYKRISNLYSSKLPFFLDLMYYLQSVFVVSLITLKFFFCRNHYLLILNRLIQIHYKIAKYFAVYKISTNERLIVIFMIIPILVISIILRSILITKRKTFFESFYEIQNIFAIGLVVCYVMQYLSILNFSGKKFYKLNLILKYVLDVTILNKTKIETKLKLIRILHSDIYETLKLIEHFYSFPILCCLIMFLQSMTVCTFYTVAEIFLHNKMELGYLLNSVLFLSIQILPIMCLTRFISQILKEVFMLFY